MKAAQIDGLEGLKALIDQEVAVSDWQIVSQEQVQAFADTTGDQQWIHTDPERARREAPFGGTIAHGFLGLSLLPRMLEQQLQLGGLKMALNYGCNKVRFPAPLPTGSRVRGRFRLTRVETIEGGAQIQWLGTLEREGTDKPVCVAEMLVRCFF
ncbi:MAG: MaoC family dehydratase [Xanthomonadales bacterium]|nr:MaoC family dehydratase [Xanthomonadales bacterium]